MAKILSVYNRLQAGDYENGNGGKRRVSRLTQFIHATLQCQTHYSYHHHHHHDYHYYYYYYYYYYYNNPENPPG